MDNASVARLFDEIADCLEIRGENPYRIRAYRNAARTLEQVQGPIGDPEELPGVGKDLAEKIRAALKTGHIPLHDQLCAQVPKGVREMMAVPGLGPKRAAVLHKRLKVSSPRELEAAAAAGKIRALRGFGQALEEQILLSLRGGGKAARRFLLPEARAAAVPLLALLERGPGKPRLELAGSYRRRQETVGDLDVLAAVDDPEGFIAWASEAAGPVRVLAKGPTKLSFLLRGGLQADLRAVKPESWGAALQYFTGSKAHGIELRVRAIARGLKLNEYGVWKGRKRVAGAAEEEVYAALGLPWIPPELREGRGEIELAAAGKLSLRLIERSDIKGDLHMHTTASDGRAELEAMVAAAAEKGYEYVAITDHSKRATIAHGLDESRMKAHWKEIDRINGRVSGLRVLKGVEVDILEDGRLDYPDELLAQADWVVASLHYGQRQPKESITKRLLSAIANPHVDAIGHPTGRLIGKRPPVDVDMEAVLAAAAARGCALELNGQPDRLDLKDAHLVAAREKGIPIVIDSDAHSTRELQDNMDWGIAQARRAGLGPADVLNARPYASVFQEA